MPLFSTLGNLRSFGRGKKGTPRFPEGAVFMHSEPVSSVTLPTGYAWSSNTNLPQIDADTDTPYVIRYASGWNDVGDISSASDKSMTLSITTGSAGGHTGSPTYSQGRYVGGTQTRTMYGGSNDQAGQHAHAGSVSYTDTSFKSPPTYCAPPFEATEPTETIPIGTIFFMKAAYDTPPTGTVAAPRLSDVNNPSWAWGARRLDTSNVEGWHNYGVGLYGFSSDQPRRNFAGSFSFNQADEADFNQGAVYEGSTVTTTEAGEHRHPTTTISNASPTSPYSYIRQRDPTFAGGHVHTFYGMNITYYPKIGNTSLLPYVVTDINGIPPLPGMVIMMRGTLTMMNRAGNWRPMWGSGNDYPCCPQWSNGTRTWNGTQWPSTTPGSSTYADHYDVDDQNATFNAFSESHTHAPGTTSSYNNGYVTYHDDFAWVHTHPNLNVTKTAETTPNVPHIRLAFLEYIGV